VSANAPARPDWLNRSTIGVTLASLFSDVSHELATAVLPAFLLSIGAGPAALGLIEGTADGVSAIAKLGGGVLTDRQSRRKPLASIGYLVTALGIALIGLCGRWWQVLFCRVVAWTGRGSRSAPRDVLLAEAVPAQHRGKAFGIERAGDAFGAVLGPLLALALISRGVGARQLMLVSLIPGLLAFLSILVLVTEKPRLRHQVATSIRDGMRATGPAFHRYIRAVFVFGCGDFSRTLLILYATKNLSGSLFSWSSATLAIALYVLHNAVSALFALPLGYLSDRIGVRPVVLSGYWFAAAVTAGFAFLPPTPAFLTLLFVGSGVYIACEEVGEKAWAVSTLDEKSRGTGMGLLAAANGVADFASSALVGGLWSFLPDRPWVGLGCAALLQAAGATLLVGVRPYSSSTHPNDR